MKSLIISAIFASLLCANTVMAQTPEPSLNAAKRKEIVNDLASKLISDYAVAETGSKMAAALREKLESNAYDNVNSVNEFARILTEDLRAVSHDKHLRVMFSGRPLPKAAPGPPPPDAIERMRKMNGAIKKLEILDGNIGYMRINAVPLLAASKDAISAAFAFLRNTDALILDNRGNGGGDPNTVAWYMSYLSEGASYIVNTFHHRKENRIQEFKTTDLGELSYGAKKPAFVLTSPNTFSGGEELTYNIQASKRGVIVGAVTGGGANPTTMVQLAHQFQASIPFGYAVNPITGSNWEGVGVKPDVEVPPEQALIEAHLLAVNQLRKDLSDPMSRASLDAIAMKIELGRSAAQGGERVINQEQLVGTYESALPIPPLTIVARDGNLYQIVPGNPESRLVSVGPNRYKLDGLPGDFFSNFIIKEGKIKLLLEQPQGSILLEKQ